MTTSDDRDQNGNRGSSVSAAARIAAEMTNSMPGLLRIGMNVTVAPVFRAAGDALSQIASAAEELAEGRRLLDVQRDLLRNARMGLRANLASVLRMEDPLRHQLALPPAPEDRGEEAGEAKGPASAPRAPTLWSITTGPSETMPSAGELRARGFELLDRSADPDQPDADHPAFAAILDQMAPDEARIVRLLAGRGEAALEFVVVNSVGRIVATDHRPLSLAATHAGCRYPDRSALYMDNLMRLGVVRAEASEADDESAYELLVVQPWVTEARAKLEAGGRGKVRMSRVTLVLTDLGERFAATCLTG